MKKSLKNLKLKKETISNLGLENVKGGYCPTHGCPNPPAQTRFCITNGALNTCPPPGMQCF